MKLTKLQKNSGAFALAGLGLLSLAGLVSAQSVTSTTTSGGTTTSARPGTSGTWKKGNRPQMTEAERAAHEAIHTAVKTAITNNDFAAFQTAMTSMEANKPAGAPTMTAITETQFATIVQAEKLRVVGDTAGAKTLLENAGIKGPFGLGGKGGHGGPSMANLTDAQKTALEQAHTLREAGKDTEAQAVLTAAGITMPVHGGRGPSAEMKAFEATLTDAQKATLKEAHKLMRSGDKTGAETLLKNAGITLPTPPVAPTTTQ